MLLLLLLLKDLYSALGRIKHELERCWCYKLLSYYAVYAASVKVTGGSVAASYLQAGDIIMSIGEVETSSLSHAQAMQAIKDCGNTLHLRIARCFIRV